MTLPPEILHHIFSFCTGTGYGSLLTTSKQISQIYGGLLYTNIYFNHSDQLKFYVNGSYFLLPIDEDGWEHSPAEKYAPRSVELDIHDLRADVLKNLSRLFRQSDGTRWNPRFLLSNWRSPDRDAEGRLCLDLLRIRAHSHTADPNIFAIRSALGAANCRQFVWVGPDPDHHFSVAIVAQVIPTLFEVLKTYTHLSHLTLTHLSFPTIPQESDENPVTVSLGFEKSISYPFPIISSLVTFTLGQAIHVHPSSVACYVLHPEMENLRMFSLVDVYMESIWGPRLRRGDVVNAAEAFLRRPSSSEATIYLRAEKEYDSALGRIDTVIQCRAMTERIVGGDRGV